MDKYPDNAEYNKLVRDRIPEIIRESGAEPETRLLSNKEVVKFLGEKFLEESQEIIEAMKSGDQKEVSKELSDVLQLIESTSERLGISMESIKKLKEERAESRGAFDKGIFLVRTREK